MKVKIIERDVMDPLADTIMEETPVNSIGDAGTISLLDNTKPGADLILRTVESALTGFNFIWSEKPAGAPARAEQIARAAGGDLCILALGDCGSCTTWVILDAIRLEGMGVPTISICSDRFSEYARRLASAQGMPGLRIVEVEHPIAGLEPEAVRRRAEKIIPSILDHLR
ncbi:UGSC family (seleno)protein [Methanothermobacter sp.]|uniref:UGSC family (seleno)protein n=1 Tax=Methanothermobacter sp. TaxID=1884223 RepID=UPI003C761794